MWKQIEIQESEGNNKKNIAKAKPENELKEKFTESNLVKRNEPGPIGKRTPTISVWMRDDGQNI